MANVENTDIENESRENVTDENNTENTEAEKSEETKGSEDSGSKDLEAEVERLQRELSKVRKEAASHRVGKKTEHERAEDLEQKVADLQARFDKSDEEKRVALVTAERAKVSREYNLPEGVEHLLGDDVEKMRETAEQLASLRGNNALKGTPTPNPSGGRTPHKADEKPVEDTIQFLMRRH